GLSTKNIIRGTFQDAAWMVGLAIISLILADYYSLGISHAILGSILGISFVKDSNRVDITDENLKQQGDERTSNLETREMPEIDVQSHSKGKNMLFIIIATMVFLIASYTWDMDYIRYMVVDSELVPWYLLINERTIIDESLMSLILFEISLIIAIAGIKHIGRRIRKSNNIEFIFIAIALGMMAGLWLLINVDSMLLGIRAQALFTPWIIILSACWIMVFALRRNRESPGLLGGTFLVILFGTWLGVILSGSEIDYTEYIMTGLLVAALVLVLVTYLHVTPHILEERHLVSRRGEGIKYKGNAKSPKKQRKTKQYKKLGKSLVERSRSIPAVAPWIIIAAVIAVPICQVSYFATSPSNFQILANVDNYSIFYLVDPMTRVDKHYKPNFGLSDYSNVNNTIQIYAARNEYEPVQVVMMPTGRKHFSIYDIIFSGFTHDENGSDIINASNFKAYRVQYIEELSNLLPDRLDEFSPFGIADGTNVPLWFTFHVPSNATAGKYGGTVTLITDNKTTENSAAPTVEFDIRLEVFNFSIPTIPTLKSNFGLPTAGLEKDNLLALFPKYRMMHWAFIDAPKCWLLTNGSINWTDFNATDAQIEELHSNGTHSVGLHIGSYRYVFLNSTIMVDNETYTPSNYSSSSKYNTTMQEYFQGFAEYYQENKTYVNDLGENISWFDEMYINGFDEIDIVGGEYKENALKEYKWLKDVGCEIPIMQTVVGYHEDTFETIDIVCQHTGGYERDYIKDWKAAGKEVWMYTTRGPRFPSPSISTSGMATQIRAIGWQAFIKNYTHYLIWDVTCPANGNDGAGYQGWNGGTIMYEGIDGYKVSTRMELVREGFEDHDYFYMLLKEPDSPQKDALLNRVNGLMNDCQPIMDYRVFNRLRVDIGHFLSV
ncbi:MAG: hypothetical protein ACFFCS_27755, partial [Candidatus Hodarchaeota archaeon]